MEIEPYWHRIAGIHCEKDGTVGCVWLAQDTMSHTVHCYDACTFGYGGNPEVLAVIGQGISSRGRWIPLAYRKQDSEISEKLRDEYGLNVLPDPVSESQQMAELISGEIRQKLRTSQFRVERRVAEWLNEYRNFNRSDQKVPDEGYPIMSATRHAIEMLPYGRPETFGQKKQPCAPRVSIF